MTTDDTTGSVVIFDADRDEVLGLVPIGKRVFDCSISADQRLGFVTTFDYEVWVIDLASLAIASGTNPIPISNAGEDIVVSADGRFLLACDGRSVEPVSSVDIAQRQEVSVFLDPSRPCVTIDTCDDGSVLVASERYWVQRLSLDEAGRLYDTGDKAFVNLTPRGTFDPWNIACAPGSRSAVVITDFRPVIQSFTFPELSPVAVEVTSGAQGLGALFQDTGSHVIVRGAERGSRLPAPGVVEAFRYDSQTGKLGDTPVFQASVDAVNTGIGIDQMALHPMRAKLYASSPGAIRVLDSRTGGALGGIVHDKVVEPYAVCFARPHPIDIDIRPGSPVNSVQTESRGVLTVSVLGSEALDVSVIETGSLTFGPGAASPAAGGGANFRDVNGDGATDLVAQFRTLEAAIAPEDVSACLGAATRDGTLLKGCDVVRTLPGP